MFSPRVFTRLQVPLRICFAVRNSPLTASLALVLTNFRKHESKHGKPYICHIPNCKHTRFGDKGGLDRHNREVHGSQTYYCPITSCKRHIRGFPRKYNLFEHQKRCHTQQSPNLALLSIPRQQSYTGNTTEGQQESDNSSGSTKETVTGYSRKLREKLENLYS